MLGGSIRIYTMLRAGCAAAKYLLVLLFVTIFLIFHFTIKTNTYTPNKYPAGWLTGLVPSQLLTCQLPAASPTAQQAVIGYRTIQIN